MILVCFKQKTAYEVRISDWSSDVCSSDLKARQASSPTARYSSSSTTKLRCCRRNYSNIPDPNQSGNGSVERPCMSALSRFETGSASYRNSSQRPEHHPSAYKSPIATECPIRTSTSRHSLGCKSSQIGRAHV